MSVLAAAVVFVAIAQLPTEPTTTTVATTTVSTTVSTTTTTVVDELAESGDDGSGGSGGSGDEPTCLQHSVELHAEHGNIGANDEYTLVTSGNVVVATEQLIAGIPFTENYNQSIIRMLHAKGCLSTGTVFAVSDVDASYAASLTATTREVIGECLDATTSTCAHADISEPDKQRVTDLLSALSLAGSSTCTESASSTEAIAHARVLTTQLATIANGKQIPHHLYPRACRPGALNIEEGTIGVMHVTNDNTDVAIPDTAWHLDADVGINVNMLVDGIQIGYVKTEDDGADGTSVTITINGVSTEYDTGDVIDYVGGTGRSLHIGTVVLTPKAAWYQTTSTHTCQQDDRHGVTYNTLAAAQNQCTLESSCMQVFETSTGEYALCFADGSDLVDGASSYHNVWLRPRSRVWKTLVNTGCAVCLQAGVSFTNIEHAQNECMLNHLCHAVEERESAYCMCKFEKPDTFAEDNSATMHVLWRIKPKHVCSNNDGTSATAAQQLGDCNSEEHCVGIQQNTDGGYYRCFATISTLFTEGAAMVHVRPVTETYVPPASGKWTLSISQCKDAAHDNTGGAGDIAARCDGNTACVGVTSMAGCNEDIYTAALFFECTALGTPPTHWRSTCTYVRATTPTSPTIPHLIDLVATQFGLTAKYAHAGFVERCALCTAVWFVASRSTPETWPDTADGANMVHTVSTGLSVYGKLLVDESDGMVQSADDAKRVQMIPIANPAAYAMHSPNDVIVMVELTGVEYHGFTSVLQAALMAQFIKAKTSGKDILLDGMTVGSKALVYGPELTAPIVYVDDTTHVGVWIGLAVGIVVVLGVVALACRSGRTTSQHTEVATLRF